MRSMILFAFMCIATSPLHAETVASVESPDKVLRVELDLFEGRLGYRVSRRGEAVINTSRLGFHLHNAEKIDRNLALASHKAGTFDEIWEQPWGERRFVRNHYNELRARFIETINLKRSIDIVFRVYDDGLGFRYEFPDQPQLKDVIIDDELTEFDVAAPATAWWIPAGEWNRYEYLYNKTPLAEVGQAHTPITIRTAGGLHVSFHEAALVSWFKPSKYVGVWWSLHLDTETWASGAKHGATTANTKRYIDFAAQHGFRGVLVEGWNPGWDGNWFGNGWNFDFTRATPDFDIEQLAAYATSKGVHLVGHHETGCAVSHYEGQLDAAFALYRRLGVDAVKTGYVCDAGQIERQDATGGPVMREWHDGQWMSRHHLKVVTTAAKYHIAVNPHEPIKDTGLRRTYPNWIAREGARGMEYNAWGNPPNPPEHEANLVFTRMLAGPMDFTPGVVSLKGRNGQTFQSTLAKQLAQYVVLYSPIQMAADLPENYEKHMDAFQFIKDVPVDWSDTRVLNGEIGDYATIARKDRNSEGWYLGSVTDEDARVLSVPLSFLDPGQRYVAEIYRDGDGAHWQTAPFAFAREQREVTSKDTLSLRLAAGGGQAIRFVPTSR